MQLLNCDCYVCMAPPQAGFLQRCALSHMQSLKMEGKLISAVICSNPENYFKVFVP